MDLYEALHQRHTIRDFSSGVIPENIIRKIIEAAYTAPTNDHMREWHFLLLNDREKRQNMINQLLKPVTRTAAVGITDQWKLTDLDQREMYIEAIPRQVSMLLNCSCLILPCFRQPSDLLKPASLSALNAFASIWMAIENLLLAATAEGVFGVTRIPFEEERKKLKEFCQIPEEYEIPCWIALGYPGKNAKRANQSTITINDRIHYNNW